MSYRSDASKNLFMQIKSLKRYENIDTEINERIKIIM